MVDVPEDAKKIPYTWPDFQDDRIKLVEIIKEFQEKNDVRFKRIYGIPRGGLILAVCLSHDLDLEFLSSPPRIYDPTTLIVDEVADWGTVLKPFFKEGYTIATIHLNPNGQVVPQIWLREKEPNVWIAYWWEKQEGESNE